MSLIEIETDVVLLEKRNSEDCYIMVGEWEKSGADLGVIFWEVVAIEKVVGWADDYG